MRRTWRVFCKGFLSNFGTILAVAIPAALLGTAKLLEDPHAPITSNPIFIGVVVASIAIGVALMVTSFIVDLRREVRVDRLREEREESERAVWEASKDAEALRVSQFNAMSPYDDTWERAPEP